MIKESKIPFLLLLIISLSACGLADPSDPIEENDDETPPSVVDYSPINNGILAVPTSGEQVELITIRLDEAIDPAALTALNALQVKSTSNIVIQGSWTLNNETNELKFIWDRKAQGSIPSGQQFKISINGEITDLAGNPLITTYQFSTAALYDIDVDVTGLVDGDSVTVKSQAGNSTSSVTLDTNNQDFSIDANLASGDSYSLSITTQATNSFCSLDLSSGTVGNNTPKHSIKCHNFQPVYPTASDWNQYYFIEDEQRWVHGGELRSIVVDSLSQCDTYSAKDSLSAFNWECSVDNTGAAPIVKFSSTGLQSGKGLSDLIKFDASPPRWRENEITIMQNGVDQINTTGGVWWANSITVIGDTTASNLSSDGTVYIIQKDSPLTTTRNIIKAGVSLVIEPGVIFTPVSNAAGINVTYNEQTFNAETFNNTWTGTWIEGNISASNSHSGIKVDNVWFTTLNNVSVSNSENNGIETSQSTLGARILNSTVDSNEGHGIYINSDVWKVQDVVSNNNSKSGITVEGSNVLLQNITSVNNDEDGVVVKGNNNKLIDIYSANNQLDGLDLSGSDKNIIDSANLVSNGGNGLQFSLTANSSNIPENNLVRNVTTANNLLSGIQFDSDDSNATLNDSLASNSLINILDAYNAPTSCPDSICDNVTSVSISNTPVDSLFSSISDESSISNFADEESFHITVAINYIAFDNQFRAWGGNSAISADAGAGTCNSNDTDTANTIRCILSDWSLNANDAAIAREQLASSNTSTDHTLSDTSMLSFLDNSKEISNDNIGNDNGLCEADESCIVTPNIGAYQGHGDLTLVDFTNDLNATLYQHENNGR